ncbi:MAG: signal peptide peptidase SppA [Desulfobacterales bacterium]|uniref:Signal peptide peptidase SppA n=1 Tax=Candidatus Desulfaltia bathyphila TaxID=2841697 RepID=A0A8J6N3B0_9BACT|nr:signal peptide peptidase SppA [Candidatus Desulfaltia bathyphila]MBL7195701.1 signal peptide peptidase SppA [Desulfobacterales bacterium]MBL7207732.1 signal peptide peptidase SppA [Desulfobacterales bacterium]
MFSRRHPYLFFILIFSSIMVTAFIGLSLVFMLATKDADFDDLLKSGGEKVGIVELTGNITSSKDIIHSLKRFRENSSIKAIVIRIDSPGGAVGPAQEIFREIRKTVKTKKVIASMGAVAASGGYYIAAGADGIVANPGTITGSIGVIMGFVNFQDLLHKIGMVPVVVKSGQYKDIGSPVREMTKDERSILQNLSNRIHKQFIVDIANGRGMDLSKVEGIADGRIFTGEEAKNLGLIDRLGNLEDAIEWAGRMGGIKGKISAVYAPKKKFSILKFIAESSVKEIANMMINPSLYTGYLYSPSR